jgi:hypothetical protein
VTNTVLPPGDRFWANPAGGLYEVASNWLGNFLPGPLDSVHFTSNATYEVFWQTNSPAANAFFDARGGLVLQSFGSWWGVTNSYVVAKDSLAAPTVNHQIGALRVTNAAGTARLVIGDGGSGTYNLIGGDVITDFLIRTNATLGRTNFFNFGHGTLRTLSGSDIVQDDHLLIGSTAGQTASWTMARTNAIVLGPSKEVRLGTGGRALLTINEYLTIATNTLAVGHSSSLNQLFINPGGRLLARTNCHRCYCRGQDQRCHCQRRSAIEQYRYHHWQWRIGQSTHQHQWGCACRFERHHRTGGYRDQ